MKVEVKNFLSWAVLDRKSGRIGGSANIAETNSTESMIKVWLVSDYLRRTAQPSQDLLQKASTAIRDSNDESAYSLWQAGGGPPVRERMIKICGLTDTGPDPHFATFWSYTRISARDAVRLGDCVQSGKAAGQKWTSWVLNEMRHVRGSTAPADQHLKSGGGRWGIVDGLPQDILADGVAIKNGWTRIWADGLWHLNCLAVTSDWVLAVLMRYPADLGLKYGADACAKVTRQLVVGPGDAPV